MGVWLKGRGWSGDIRDGKGHKAPYKTVGRGTNEPVYFEHRSKEEFEHDRDVAVVTMDEASDAVGRAGFVSDLEDALAKANGRIEELETAEAEHASAIEGLETALGEAVQRTTDAEERATGLEEQLARARQQLAALGAEADAAAERRKAKAEAKAKAKAQQE